MQARYKPKGRIKTKAIGHGIHYRKATKKPPSMAAIYQGIEAGIYGKEETMTAIYAKIAQGGKGGAAALSAFLDALE
jgi:hypothetical protein